MNVIFKKLYIIDKNTKKAKIQEFKDGLNLVSSDAVGGGNYSGKSTLLRSLYYTLGAEVWFDISRGWQSQNKYYFVLKALVDDNPFSILRFDNYFAIYDRNNHKIFSTHNRDQLSAFYSSFFGVKPLLKNRNTSKYVPATPFSLFVLSFIDQKKYNEGNTFKSFAKQDEFADYKEDLILFHLGINNSQFNELQSSINTIEDEISANDEKKNVISKLLNKAKESFDDNYTQDTSSLKVELEKHKREYEELLAQQSKLRSDLYALNDNKTRLLHYINGLKEAIKESKPEKILQECQCPLCKNQIENYTEVFFKVARNSDDFSLEVIDCESEVEEIQRSIDLKTQKYESLSDEVKKIERIVDNSSKEKADMVKSIGYKKCIDSLTEEYSSLTLLNTNKENELKEKKKELRQMMTAKKEINQKYSDLFKDAVRKDSITIIDIPEGLKIGDTISCSDNHVLVVVWLNILNKMKKELNPNGVFFPIIIDNPTDRDFSSDNKDLVLKYAFEMTKSNKQVFVSKTSFANDVVPEGLEYSNINLINKQFNLLCEDDYDAACSFLKELTCDE